MLCYVCSLITLCFVGYAVVRLGEISGSDPRLQVELGNDVVVWIVSSDGSEEKFW